MMKIFLLLCFIKSIFALKIVVAENFYGELAKELMPNADVYSIITNVDPHIFNITPRLQEKVLSADIVIYNGMDYDNWMTTLVQNRKTQNVINVGNIVRLNNRNPHIWYNPTTFLQLADALSIKMQELQPKEKSQVQSNLIKFKKEYQIVLNKVKLIHDKYHNINVLALEPVYNYMIDFLGFNNCNIDMQYAIMNDTELTAKMMKGFQSTNASLFFYNTQISSQFSNTFLDIANEKKLKTISVTETMPPNTSITAWMMAPLNEIDRYLGEQRKTKAAIK